VGCENIKGKESDSFVYLGRCHCVSLDRDCDASAWHMAIDHDDDDRTMEVIPPLRITYIPNHI
jgi:hypothetical protein